MRNRTRIRCVQRTAPKQSDQDIRAWARRVIDNPSAHLATAREAAIVADLLSKLEDAR